MNAPTPTRAIRVPDALWSAAQRKAAARRTTVTAEISRFLASWALEEPSDPEVAIAFLRACHRGDEAGVRSIVESANVLDLLFGVAASSNQVGEGQIVDGKPIGAREWDRRLGACRHEAARQRAAGEVPS